MVASSMLVLVMLSRFSLPDKRISVSWALFKSKILGTIQRLIQVNTGSINTRSEN